MRDLTKGSVLGHLIYLAVPIAAGMLFQNLYYLVDLFFVAQISEAAIAGVGAAGNIQFLVMALTQVLGVGTMALIAHASGRKDREDANLVFNQSLTFGAACAGIVLVGGYAIAGYYVGTLGADEATTAAGTEYLMWYLPGLALQFALVAMGSALRGTGIVKPTMIVQIASVALNAVLAPIMIAGWLTGYPMGVMGAGLSSSISVAVAVVMMLVYFIRLESFVGFDTSLIAVRTAVWRRILKIGLPPGGEFSLIFVFASLIYWAIRGFGADAQAGYGVGSRVMQAIFLPAMAVAFATAPLAGQNYGAGCHDRVRSSLRTALILGSSLMVSLTLFCQWRPEVLIGMFSTEPEVLDVGVEYLRILSWNFVSIGLVFTISSTFQALGNTVPSFLASATRFATFAGPVIWLTTWTGFELRHIWYVSIFATSLQALTGALLLRLELKKRLNPAT